MHAPTVSESFESLPSTMSVDEYNFEHFRPKHLLADIQRSIHMAGIRPGELAPDFELPRVGGGTLRLSDLHDQPTMLHFGSFT